MADINLRFETPLDTSKPVDLRFGAPLVDVGYPTSYLTVAGTLPAPTLFARVGKLSKLTLAATIPGPRFVGATMTVPKLIRLAGTLPAPAFVGAKLAWGHKTQLSATLPAPRFLGASFHLGDRLNLSATITAPKMYGTMKHGYIFRVASTIPAPKMTAGLKLSLRMSLAGTLPAPKLTARFQKSLKLSLTATLPSPHFVGARFVLPASLRLSKTLPAPKVVSSLIRRGPKLVMSATIPAPHLAGYIGEGAHLTLAATIPKPKMTGSFVKPDGLNASATLPHPFLSGRIEHVHQMTGSATLPGIKKVTGRIEHVHQLTGVGSVLAGPTLQVHLGYENSVYRGPSGHNEMSWQPTDKRNTDSHATYETAFQQLIYDTVNWAKAMPTLKDNGDLWQSMDSTRVNGDSKWSEADKLRAVRVTDDYADMIRLKNNQDSGWAEGKRVTATDTDGWEERFHYPRVTLKASWTEGTRDVLDYGVPFDVGTVLTSVTEYGYWQEAMRPGPGGYTITPPIEPPVVPGEICYTPPKGKKVALLFADPLDHNADILFICGQHGTPPAQATNIVPTKRTYIVLNEIHLFRVEGNIELPATSLSMNIDMSSWSWAFNAAMPAYALSLVQPGVDGKPVLLRAQVNGKDYMMLAESVSRNRQFGASGITVSGRGQSAILADPYTEVRQFSNEGGERMAQQLMLDALTTNGVSIGWALDWRITDWLVPAGSWSHQGTYVTALNAIAAAAGAFIQPDPVNKILRVRPRYPVAPWDWYKPETVPDLELPTAAIITEGVAWANKPGYNSVYVSGTNAGGILGHVKRAGTAGDLNAQMITDALITHADAARQRGLSVLADTGRIATYSLNLPVLVQTGIIDPGTLIRYTDGDEAKMGLVKGVSVSAGQTRVSQTIEVEVHG